MVFSQTLRRAAAISAPLAPKYYVPRNVGGIDARTAIHGGMIAGGFGVVAGVGALFIFGEVPRVRRDVLQKLPFFDQYLDRSISPEDNPF